MDIIIVGDSQKISLLGEEEDMDFGVYRVMELIRYVLKYLAESLCQCVYIDGWYGKVAK